MYLDDLKTLEPELEKNEEHVDGVGEWTGTDRIGDSIGDVGSDDVAEEGRSEMIGDVGGDDAENDRLVMIEDEEYSGMNTVLVCGESWMEAEVKGGGEEKEEGDGDECNAESEWTSEEAEM